MYIIVNTLHMGWKQG